MFGMTKRADYALIALAHLANAADDDPARLVNTKEIAEQYEIPLELLAKILQILAKNNLVASHPGPTGGYRLLRDPKQVSVAEVLILIDGQISMLHCSNGQGDSCKQYNRCTVRDPLAEIEIRIQQLLASITIDEISVPAAQPHFEDFSRRTFPVGLPVG